MTLAEKYAEVRVKIKLYVLERSYSKGVKLFTEKDLEKAFDAGRKSVLNNIPKLKWIDGGEATEEYLYAEGYYAWTHFGIYTILRWKSRANIDMCLNGERLDITTKDINQAKALIEEDHKERVNQMLGL